MSRKINENIKLFKKNAISRLDIGCGENCGRGWIGMDRRKVKGVDIVHDVQKFPWPLYSNSCFQILMSHLWEHIEPKHRIAVMDEIHRIIRPDGQLPISVPYAGSFGNYQDPTHYFGPNEATFTYFDPSKPLYQVYKPRPWKLIRNEYQVTGNMEVILEPIKKKRKK